MSTTESAVIRWASLTQTTLLPGVSAATRMGAQLSATLFHLEPHAVVPRHSHPNEEFGQLITGSLTLAAGAETMNLVAGEAFLIPGDVPHSATAGAHGCTLLECYAPPRNPDPASQKEATQ
ncbi:cupin domain-containing protein [Rathayibacter soli]|uniref:cupin domain-containing protein n=1 Tax=Rathayibacter soli TaxID=3144168 RepID=UPI0027E53D9D|nr:cupin domain-containing protein [Glaciibacter superstes]